MIYCLVMRSVVGGRLCWFLWISKWMRHYERLDYSPTRDDPETEKQRWAEARENPHPKWRKSTLEAERKARGLWSYNFHRLRHNHILYQWAAYILWFHSLQLPSSSLPVFISIALCNLLKYSQTFEWKHKVTNQHLSPSIVHNLILIFNALGFCLRNCMFRGCCFCCNLLFIKPL